jgi:hypothetical protein
MGTMKIVYSLFRRRFDLRNFFGHTTHNYILLYCVLLPSVDKTRRKNALGPFLSSFSLSVGAWTGTILAAANDHHDNYAIMAAKRSQKRVEQETALLALLSCNPLTFFGFMILFLVLIFLLCAATAVISSSTTGAVTGGGLIGVITTSISWSTYARGSQHDTIEAYQYFPYIGIAHSRREENMTPVQRKLGGEDEFVRNNDTGNRATMNGTYNTNSNISSSIMAALSRSPSSSATDSDVVTTGNTLRRLSNSFYNGAGDDDWSRITKIAEDPSCPKIIFAETDQQGLADLLERLFIGLAVAYRHKDQNVTMVVRDSFGRGSFHNAKGYIDIIHGLLGLPKFITWTAMRATIFRNRPMKEVTILKDYGRYLEPGGSVTFSCGTIYKFDAYDSCGGRWCPFEWSDKVQSILKPLLRQRPLVRELATGTAGEGASGDDNIPPTTCSSRQFEKLPILSDKVNIVWHVRSGDACPHCDEAKENSNSSYFHDLYDFIEKGLGPKYQNNMNIVVVHQKDFTSRIPGLFRGIPQQSILYRTDDLKNVICTFASADILISMGSTFPLLMSWFTPQHKPIVLQDIRMAAISEKAKILYAVREEDGFRMENGHILTNTSQDLHRLLSRHTFPRIDKFLNRTFD